MQLKERGIEMKRLTKREHGLPLPKGGFTQDVFREVTAKLTDYEDAEEQGRLFVSKYGVGQIIFAVIPTDEYEDCNTFYIETYRVCDVSASGAITVDTYEKWTLEDQEDWHVCGTREEAETKLKELEKDNGQ